MAVDGTAENKKRVIYPAYRCAFSTPLSASSVRSLGRRTARQPSVLVVQTLPTDFYEPGQLMTETDSAFVQLLISTRQLGTYMNRFVCLINQRHV